MPTPDWVKEKARKRRERTCPICDKHFLASRPSAKGFCSRECQDINFSRVTTGRKQSDETKRKRAMSISKFRAGNPDAERDRINAVTAATQTDDYRNGAFLRYLKMAEQKSGICSDDIRDYTAARSKWVMKKAREALNCETEFTALWTDTLDRLRRENPYDGPMGTADYVDYCRKIGAMLTADPQIRAAQDEFFREAIPRFGKEWDAAQDCKPWRGEHTPKDNTEEHPHG